MGQLSHAAPLNGWAVSGPPQGLPCPSGGAERPQIYRTTRLQGALPSGGRNFGPAEDAIQKHSTLSNYAPTCAQPWPREVATNEGDLYDHINIGAQNVLGQQPSTLKVLTPDALSSSARMEKLQMCTQRDLISGTLEVLAPRVARKLWIEAARGLLR